MSTVESTTIASFGDFAPGRHRFTVEQYHRMLAAGVLTPDDRVQLLEGELIRMSPKGPLHVFAVVEAADRITALLPAGWHVRRQDPITLADSEPEPDIVVARGGPRRYRKRHPRSDEIALVVEVADTTLLLDRQCKAPIYAAAGIPEYWILNLADRRVEIYTKPEPASARRPARYSKRRDVDENGVLELVLAGQKLGKLRVSEWL
jgi:Uma2 family endonuclease